MSESGYDLPGELRALADGIERDDFEVEETERGDFTLGEDTIDITGEWVQ